MSDQERCENCRFFVAPSFKCHRHAPALFFAAKYTHPETIWPTVFADNWCGDWVGQPQPEEFPPTHSNHVTIGGRNFAITKPVIKRWINGLAEYTVVMTSLDERQPKEEGDE